MIFEAKKAFRLCWCVENLMHMKTSLKKLRGFAVHHRHDGAKDQRDVNARPLAQLDELARATRDMQDIRDCYDSLLSAAAATANSAYEFSESLRDLGSCLLEKAATNDGEETGKVLIMLGKAQFELQRVVDNYRSHVFQTITAPSESLLNELQTVEEMRRQCDEKRDVYEYMAMRHKDDENSRSPIGDVRTRQKVKEAHDEYDEEATLFVFRLKSLKRGQSRCLLTQAARHHAAQLRLFQMACKSLEEVDPLVKSVTEQQHIDYYFSGLDDEEGSDDSEDDESNSSDLQDKGELSFDYGGTEQEHYGVSTSRIKTELDQPEITFPQFAMPEPTKEELSISHEYHGDNRTFSQSAPLLAEKTLESKEKIKQLRQSSSRKFHAYVLPTPVDKKVPPSVASSRPVISKQKSLNLRSLSLSNSALEPKRDLNISGDRKIPRFSDINLQSILKQRNNNYSDQVPPPLAGSLLLTQHESCTASDKKKSRRRALSGPLMDKQSDKPPPVQYSGPVMRKPMLEPPPSSSPKVSPLNSPTLASSPKISELHELPRPPVNPIPKSARPFGFTHLDRLDPRSKDLFDPNQTAVSRSMSPLPRPPKTIVRSFSIPSSGPASSKLLEDPSIMEEPENVVTPPGH